MPKGSIVRAVALIAIVFAWGCGGGSGTVTVPQSVSISASPTSSRVPVRGTQTFSANVTGSTNTAVTWSITEGATGGSISANGTYTAPASAGVYHVKATSVADSSKSVAVPVTVHPTVSTTTSATMTIEEKRTFAATVSGATNTAVTWSLRSGGAGGSITSGGIFTAPNVPGSVAIVVTCLADPLEQATINVTVQAGSASGTIE